jgi:uncharacterized membrane protein
MINPFDFKTVFLAKHAQHVVLIHFPIAMFISGAIFDLLAHWRQRAGLRDAAYYNLGVAAFSTLPVLGTGVLAWRFQLEGQTLKGLLLLHVLSAIASSLMIWLVWWFHLQARRQGQSLSGFRIPIELLGIVLVALTGHLGGYLSGVNLPG